MALLIDSAPKCVQNVANSAPDAADTADFIVQAAYEKCAGIMTFGPGSTYGAEGVGATTAYYVLTALGAAFMVVSLIAWVVFENRRLASHTERLIARESKSQPPASPMSTEIS